MNVFAGTSFADAAEMMLAYPAYARFCIQNCDALMEDLKSHFTAWHSLCRSLFNSEKHAFAAAALSAQLTLLTSFAEHNDILSRRTAANTYHDISCAVMRTMLNSVHTFDLSDYGTQIRNQQSDVCIPPVLVLSDADDIGESAPD